jgi:hypothetical protein
MPASIIQDCDHTVENLSERSARNIRPLDEHTQKQLRLAIVMASACAKFLESMIDAEDFDALR